MSPNASYRTTDEVAQRARRLGAEGGDLLPQTEDVLGHGLDARPGAAACRRSDAQQPASTPRPAPRRCDQDDLLHAARSDA